MSTDYISLQGEMLLAKRVNGVAGAYRSVGNASKLSLKVTTEKTEHTESKTGQRSTDRILYKKTGVEISGDIEEVNKENLAFIMSGENVEIAANKITDQALGSVKSGEIINLGSRNLSNVVFKDDKDTTIGTDQYVLDAVYGTVTFSKDIASVKWSGDAGARTRTVVANRVGKDEYSMLFKGVDTASNQRFVVELWRIQFSPETEFDLINEDFGSYSISGNTLSDIAKGQDAQLGLYGTIERF